MMCTLGERRGNVTDAGSALIHHHENQLTGLIFMMVPERRLELPRPCGHQHLKLTRLPFRHSGLKGVLSYRSGGGLVK